ncbi:MAG: hypothetical protein H7Y38_18620 [Armatimonadetes bacterium]|nr:hypothetical protein [Armatimonadota bacterium]
MENVEKILQPLKQLYLVPNPFQLWAWILTVLAILFLIPGTRRTGGIGFLVGVGCMGIFFGLQRIMNDYAPSEKKIEATPPPGRVRHR